MPRTTTSSTWFDDVGRNGVAALRADMDQLANQIADVENTVDNLPREADIARVQQRVEDSVNDVRAECDDRHSLIRARVSVPKTDTDVLEEAVTSLEDWQATIEQRWEENVRPWINYWYDHSDVLHAVVNR